MTTLAEAKEPSSTTATLQMIRAEVNVREFHRWMGGRRLQDPDHAMHCLLAECFGELAPKPFRLIIPRDGPVGTLYGYGPAGADRLRETAAICADPLQCRIITADSMDSKPMPTQFPTGKILGFELRIRPVVRRARGAINPGSERDVFQLEAEKYPKGEMPYSREHVYVEWLSGQMERNGAILDKVHTRLVSFQRTRAIRKLRQRHCEGPDAIMQGNLTITNSAAFAEALAHGIGRHRAYGYGMLLLRQPRR